MRTAANKDSDLEALKKAKGALKQELQRRFGITSVGIGTGPKGLRLRINVDPNAGIDEAELPTRYRGFEVEVVHIGRYNLRPA